MENFKKLFLFSLISITLLALTCKKSPVENEDNLSRRDYVWSVDTISMPDSLPQSFQISMCAIWGSDTDNVYIAGHNAMHWGKVFHFSGENSGKKWQTVELPRHYGLAAIRDIIGIDKNNIFFVGQTTYFVPPDDHVEDSSLIYRFDGSVWELSLINKGSQIWTIAGSGNELYAAGLNKTFFKYNGSEWEKKELNIYIPKEYETSWCSSFIRRKNGEFLMNYNASRIEDMILYQVKKKGDEWVKIDSVKNIEKPKWCMKLWESPEGTLYSYAGGVVIYNGTTWTPIFKYDYFNALGGTSDNNIFAAGEKIVHYNGRDWYEFKEFTGSKGLGKYGIAQDLQCFDKQVFILYSDSHNSYVIRGKLK